MLLIKETKSKFREVWYDGEYYYKTWKFVDKRWLEAHVKLLDICAEDLVADYTFQENSMTLKMNKIEGTLANTYKHTQEFFNMIYSACLKDLDRTSPYAHGDWVLSNMIITKDNEVKFIDWDNVNLFPRKGAIMKIHMDLKSAFDNNFERFLNDSTSI